MPFCPVCRFEYRPGFAVCGDCGAALVDTLPSPAGQDWLGAADDVAIVRVHGQAVAEMWAELLGRSQIACRLIPISPSFLGLVPTDVVLEIRVAASDAQRARTILPQQAGADRTIRARPGSQKLTPAKTRRRTEIPRADRVLNDVDRAIERGDLDLADRLLRSVDRPVDDHRA